jgi:hypothetical protein
MLTFAADIWQWSELTSFGDLPTPRDFAAAAAIGSQKIVLYVSNFRRNHLLRFKFKLACLHY